MVAAAGSCAICGLPARPGDPLTADHVVPRSRGGVDSIVNYRAAHRSCNSRRGSARLEGDTVFTLASVSTQPPRSLNASTIAMI
jgi:5-methylcytosine-specific restriction endonuclease McrA